MLIGIISGLLAAFCQSLSYLATRHFVHRRHVLSPHAGRQLLVLSHVWMGLFSLILLWGTWPQEGMDLAGILGPVVQMAGFYLVGQCATTFSLRYTEPSRVSPLLGFKIVILALLVTFLTLPHPADSPPPRAGLGGWQWLAVLLSVIAVVALNFSGAALRKRAIGWILLACIMFAGSDWNIVRTNMAIHAAAPGVSLLHASLLSAGLCYGLTGVAGCAFTPLYGSRRGRDWIDALPFALVWFLAMVFLYWCFSQIGPLLGNILQSTRGLMSILMASLLIRHGHLHLEPAAGRRALLRRLAAGALMFLAVSLYVVGESRYRGSSSNPDRDSRPETQSPSVSTQP